MHDLEMKFPSGMAALCALFGYQRVADNLQQLQAIYDYTEAAWQGYAAQIEIVRFVMIAEAPPWRADQTRRYILDPLLHDEGPYNWALRKAFPGADVGSWQEVLRVLARHGFLLLDSIPFAMSYTSSKRRGPKYDNLVHHSVTTYLQQKLDSSRVSWSPEVRIAFAAKRLASSVLKTLSHLSVHGRQHPLSPDMIAVNRANYPDPMGLRRIYGFGDGGDTSSGRRGF